MRNNFYNRFLHFIKEKALFDPEEKVLLAISGGIDSTVMAYLFHRAGFKFVIAHCNFQLRDSDSEDDEQSVKNLAKRFEAPFFVKRFETRDFADQNQLSIQMAARELRYTWFRELMSEHGYSYLATAHHKDDFAETVILNLAKGSVLNGLHGILPKNNDIIRPLLWAGKEEIRDYASERKIGYREDASNAENKYQRNLIRNEVIPLLKKINPDVSETIYQSADRRLQIEAWLKQSLHVVRNRILKTNEEGSKILISDIKEIGLSPEIFFELTEEYGFTYSQIEDLFALLHETEVKVFNSSAGYRMVKDRSIIIIQKNEAGAPPEIMVHEPDKEISYGGGVFRFETIPVAEISDLKNNNHAYLDFHSVSFPFTIRQWRQGDSFRPFGLKGKKLVSDFLTDIKLPFIEKENQLVLVSEGKICWVVGQRVDDNFKINPHTQKVLHISYGN